MSSKPEDGYTRVCRFRDWPEPLDDLEHALAPLGNGASDTETQRKSALGNENISHPQAHNPARVDSDNRIPKSATGRHHEHHPYDKAPTRRANRREIITGRQPEIYSAVLDYRGRGLYPAPA